MNRRIVAGQQADAQRAPSKRITTGDLAAVATLLSLGMMSWLVPVEWLGPVARAIGRGTALWHGRGTSPTVKYVGGLRAAHDIPWAAPDIHKQYQDHRRETRLMVLALNRPARHWRPIVRCKGLDHLQSSLERGLGTILWVSGFAYTEILTLVALQQAGMITNKVFHGSSRGIEVEIHPHLSLELTYQ